MTVSRRKFIKSSFVLGGLASLNANNLFSVGITSNKANSGMKSRIPRKGEEFNESFEFPDEATGRFTRRLTSNRQFNQKPTYHLSSGFSQDDQYLTFCTWNEGEGSALVRANIENGDCKVLDYAEAGAAFEFSSGNNLEMIPMTNLAVIRYKQSFRVYDIHSAELVFQNNSDGKGYFSGAVGTCDGRSLIVIRNDHDFSFRRDDGKKDPYKALGYSMFRIELQSGKEEQIFRDDNFRGGHAIPSPVDPNLVLYHRDTPPKFSHGGDFGQTSRNWILNIRTGKLTEIRPNDPSKFTWHANWSYQGDYVYYHGPSGDQSMHEKFEKIGSPYKNSPAISHFIGVADIKGNIAWEKQYPFLYYGHVSSHRLQNVIIIDNLLADEYLSGIHWEERDKDENPKIELLAKHNSTYMPGAQTRHPHCQMTSNGKWISYNAQFDQRADVYVVKMK